MTEDWTITGDYVEACNCDAVCQCLWFEPPDDNSCTVSIAWHITDGQYGDVDVSGLSVGLLAATEEGVMLDPDTAWGVVLLIDESADEAQRAALEDIYLGRAGGIFAALAETHVDSAEIASAPFVFTRDGADFAVEIGDAVRMEATGTAGFNEKLGTIAPHPFTKSTEFHTGKSTTARVSYDDQFTWDVSENNSYLGDFELANA